MTVLDRLADWFRTPVIEVEVFKCPDCSYETADRAGSCPECGEPLERTETYEYGYWDPIG